MLHLDLFQVHQHSHRVHASGRKEDVSEETRNVIEKLTGVSYDKCFGNNNIGYKE